MSKSKDLAGRRFGLLVANVLNLARSKYGKTQWDCKCDCGRTLTVLSNSLLSDRALSCGCVGREKTVKRNTTHNKSKTSEYGIYHAMLKRCYNANTQQYFNYGGRGIKICERWLESFENFLEDMGERPSVNHSIDRIDNDGDYTPENCRWATYIVQCRNKNNNRLIKYKGAIKTAMEWSEITGVRYTTLIRRLNKGMVLDKVFERVC